MLSSKRTWLICGLVAVGAAMGAALAHPAGRAHRAGHEGEPDADPVGVPPRNHEGDPDADPVGVPPRKMGERTLMCRSADRKYEVDLRFASPKSTLPSRAHVVIDGRPPEIEPAWLPPPGELTCSTEPGSDSNAWCRVEGTADYGYIAKVSTDQGHPRVELVKNGLASTRLATFDCPE